MPVYCHEIVIGRPVEDVFDGIADVKTHPKWQEGLVGTEVNSTVSGVGFRGTELRRMFGRTLRFHYEITHHERPRAWGFRALDGPVRPHALLRFESTPLGTIVTSYLTVPGITGWLFGRIMLKQQKRNYQRLKTLLETGTLKDSLPGFGRL